MKFTNTQLKMQIPNKFYFQGYPMPQKPYLFLCLGSLIMTHICIAQNCISNTKRVDWLQYFIPLFVKPSFILRVIVHMGMV